MPDPVEPTEGGRYQREESGELTLLFRTAPRSYVEEEEPEPEPEPDPEEELEP